MRPSTPVAIEPDTLMGGAKAHYDGIVALPPDRLHRGSEEDQCAGAGHAQRRRPDRALCCRRSAISEAAEARDAQDLQGLSARHDHHSGRHDQRGPPRHHQKLRRSGAYHPAGISRSNSISAIAAAGFRSLMPFRERTRGCDPRPQAAPGSRAPGERRGGWLSYATRTAMSPTRSRNTHSKAIVGLLLPRGPRNRR